MKSVRRFYLVEAGTRLRYFADIALRCATVGWLAIHFFLTVVYVMPSTPLKFELQPILSETIQRYVDQNWSLFAPNPVSSNQTLLVKCLTDDEVYDGPTHGVSAQNWHDLSTPLWQAFQGNRFSAYERVGRPHSNAIRAYLGGVPPLAPWAEACRKGDVDACGLYDHQLQVVQERATMLLRRIASSFCNRLSTSSSEFAGVAIRIKEVAVRRWSDRYEIKDLLPDYKEVGAFPIDKAIQPSPIF
jgi:hypothetical protein